MPLSNPINPHSLVPGKQYLIDIRWNITNDLMTLPSPSIIGTFIEHNYVRGRTYSYDSGLSVLLSRSRYESLFMVNGQQYTVSSVNKFYEILHPPIDILAKSYVLFRLPIHNDIKKYICKFTDYILDLCYRPKPKTK
jgi:hypothetical protein